MQAQERLERLIFLFENEIIDFLRVILCLHNIILAGFVAFSLLNMHFELKTNIDFSK